MNRIALYIFLILIFLGISRSFSPSERGLIYIRNDRVFSSFFSGAPLSIILVNETQTGFFIKTYYQKYKVIYGFQRPYFVTVRTSKSFWEKNKPNIGLSIFRRDERSFSESSIPMPPGILYVGNLAYGDWISHKSGEYRWVFHKAYRDPEGLNFPRFFGWVDFTPTREMFEKAKVLLAEERPFYGIHNEFGFEGETTKKAFPESFKRKQKNPFSWSDFFSKYLNSNPFKARKKS